MPREYYRGKRYNKLTDDPQEVAFEMDKRTGRFGKSLIEDVSIRRPASNYEEFPEILDADGQCIDPESDPIKKDYTFDAKVHRVLPTRRNRDIDENLYEREDAYYVHFRCPLDFLKISDEILWHKHIEKSNDDTFDIVDLQDTTKGVLTIISVEEHRGTQRLYCQLYDIA